MQAEMAQKARKYPHYAAKSANYYGFMPKHANLNAASVNFRHKGDDSLTAITAVESTSTRVLEISNFSTSKVS
jgi:hypothetical protein